MRFLPGLPADNEELVPVRVQHTASVHHRKVRLRLNEGLNRLGGPLTETAGDLPPRP